MKDEAHDDNFNKAFNTMMHDLDKKDHLKEKQDKNLIQDLWKSKIYRISYKPWQVVDMEKFLTW